MWTSGPLVTEKMRLDVDQTSPESGGPQSDRRLSTACPLAGDGSALDVHRVVSLVHAGSPHGHEASSTASTP